MSDALSLVGWTILPGFATSTLLTIYYRLITRAGEPIPQRGTPRYTRAYRNTHILVVASYLLYTIYEVYHTIVQTGNFYDLLQSPQDSPPSFLRQRFRRLSVLYHPDKRGDDGALFVALKQGYDVLIDENKRWAYERFGPEMLGWKVATAWEFLLRGVQASVGYYLVSALILVVFSVLGKFEFGKYWRFLTLLLLLTIESYIITRPFSILNLSPIPRILEFLRIKPLLPYEQLVLLRRISLSFFVAINQLGGLFSKPSATSSKASMQQNLEQLLGLGKFVEAEARKTAVLEVLPFDGDGDGNGGELRGDLKTLQRRVGEWMVEMQVRNDPEMREVQGKVVRRRREGAPKGAKVA
ncbi:hypothetical protein EX30DRAFT_301716 [Ascodesmis nigricans]|uniref:J domain-containing protein n=1 Tax=Ascodesmis nigricans TaxID=341454 RepID=A0A4S2N5X8_9PEZI|nr:hypothetical protein EX30DRAFT_301716 [Ascodesmis nigricans]